MIKAAVLENTVEDIGDTFGNRILLLLRQQQRNKAWLANKIGISKQAMNYLLNHASKPKFVNEIAFALGVNSAWLSTGKGTMVFSDVNHTGTRVISCFNINDFFEQYQNIHLYSNNIETITVDENYSSSCFAVRLENTSMEPLFQQGCILIFDPTVRPNNSDYVFFSLKKTQEVFFRQYFHDGGDVYLNSIDKMYKNFKNENIVIHGVLIESRNHFK